MGVGLMSVTATACATFDCSEEANCVPVDGVSFPGSTVLQSSDLVSAPTVLTCDTPAPGASTPGLTVLEEFE